MNFLSYLGSPYEAASYAHDAQPATQLWTLQKDGSVQTAQSYTGTYIINDEI